MYSEIAYSNVLLTLLKKLHLANILNVAAWQNIIRISISTPAPSVIIIYVAVIQLFS